MTEQSIDQAATSGSANPADAGQGITRDAGRLPLDAEGGDAPVPDAERRAQNTPGGHQRGRDH